MWGLFPPGAFSHATYVGDFFRLACIIIGGLMIGRLAWIANIVRNTRKWGIYALIFFAFSAVGTEYMRLGDVVTWRLVTNISGVIFGLIYTYKMDKGGYIVREDEAKHRRPSDSE